MHRLLKKQLKKLSLADHIQPDQGQWSDFTALVQRSYQENDRDRYTLERSLRISSEEMRQLYDQQKQLYEGRLQAILSAMPDLLFMLDQDGRYLEVISPDGSSLYQEKDELIGKQLHDILPEDVADRFASMIARAIESNTLVIKEYELDVNGDKRIFEGRVMPSTYQIDGKHTVIFVARDITDIKQSREKIEYIAKHDFLTGMSNRQEFERRISEIVKRSEDGEVHAMLFIDLDRFKVVNDTCGHLAGDELLREIPELLHRHIRKADLVARLGGDEFGIFMEYCGEDRAVTLARQVRQSVADYQFVWEGQTFKVGASIGVVLLSKQDDDIAEIMRKADTACYTAKDWGRNQVVVYQSDNMDLKERSGEIKWVSRINKAFEKNQFVLYAQLFDSVTRNEGSKRSFEVLVRMKNENGSVIMPGAFLRAAENYGLMLDIDRWVVSEAITQLSGQKEFLESIDYCSINLSGVAIVDKSFLNLVVDLLATLDGYCHKICFEVTETVAINNFRQATKFMKIVRGMGACFALDDFGSGLSSYAYLKTLPYDIIKIDGMFVRGIDKDPVDRAMVQSISDVARAMQKKTVAEYVENEGILEVLREIGIDYAQGFAIAVPQPLESYFHTKTVVS